MTTLAPASAPADRPLAFFRALLIAVVLETVLAGGALLLIW